MQPDGRHRGGHRADEAAIAAPDIQQLPVPVQRVCREDLARDQRLRGGHQFGILGHLLGRQRGGIGVAGIGPVAAQFGAIAVAAQQRHRIAQVCIEQRVVFDHRDHAGVADQGGAEHAQAVAAIAALLDQPQRRGGGEQPVGGILGQGQALRQVKGIAWRVLQDGEETQPHAGE